MDRAYYYQDTTRKLFYHTLKTNIMDFVKAVDPSDNFWLYILK
jgi:hypothetical protein